LEEIIVTAQRRDQTVAEIPYNISAVSGDYIDSGKILSTGELLQGVPGASVIDWGARNAGNVNAIRIRGLAIDSSINMDVALSAVPPVSTYLNETPVYANLLLKDIERVEVLRGPQGTLRLRLWAAPSLHQSARYWASSGRAEASFSQTSGSNGRTGTPTSLNFRSADRPCASAHRGHAALTCRTHRAGRQGFRWRRSASRRHRGLHALRTWTLDIDYAAALWPNDEFKPC
jgi:hypothetical protein